MSDDQPLCRLCGNAGVRVLGAIPDSDYFAGRVLSTPIAGGKLYGCATCRSMFREPAQSSIRYLELYAQGKATQWSGGEHRFDLRLICSLLAGRARTDSILDVGCGSGDFLGSLSSDTRKFGVEPAEAAAKTAAERGVTIIGATLDGVPVDTRFDAITMIDVIEHLTEPGNLLSQAYSHLSPGGVLLVSTGDPGNKLWGTLFRSRFWYCGFPEHISFPSFGFFQRWAADTPGAAVARRVIRYQRLTPAGVLVAALMQISYFLSPSMFNLVGRWALRIRGIGAPRRRFFVPGIPGLFKDHQVVTITRRSPS